MAINTCMTMPTSITNIATCIAQVTMEVVHQALLINHVWFRLTSVEVLANFFTHKYIVRLGLWYRGYRGCVTKFSKIR